MVGPDEAALAEADAVLAGASLWPGERMDGGPNVKVISRTGIGYDTVDLGGLPGLLFGSFQESSKPSVLFLQLVATTRF